MIAVVDKKIAKYVLQAGDVLLEIPIRISFEYTLESSTFIDGSMQRDVLFNRDAVLKRCPELDHAELDEAIDEFVDRTLEEHLLFTGQACGGVELYEVEEPSDEDEETAVAPEIILP